MTLKNKKRKKYATPEEAIENFLKNLIIDIKALGSCPKKLTKKKRSSIKDR